MAEGISEGIINNNTKTYTIIAGINGAGKTSLYSVISGEGGLGVRINTDELVEKWGGNWHDTLIQIKAGRAAMEMISDCINRGVSFHHETTLPGPTIIKYVKKARAVGYRIHLYYVGVDSLDIAVDRVHRRIAQGGHGIEDHIIAKRYAALPTNLTALLPYCDLAVFYDNTVRFRQIAIIHAGEIIDCDRVLPLWFEEIVL